MSSEGINPEILKSVRETCDDEELCKFIVELIVYESDNSGSYHYKGSYNKLIEKYSGKKAVEDED